MDRNLRRRRISDRITIGLFLLPALVLFGVLVVVPILVAAYTSLFRWNGFGGLPTDFIGLDNFVRLLDDPVFIGDLRRGALLVVLSVTVQLPLALGLALLLNQKLRGRAVYRVLFFAPYVLSEVITAVLFTMVFSPNRGLANHVLGLVGLESLSSTWLSDPSTVLYSVFLVMTWKYFGFHMVLLLAGRQNIPRELHEAAATDGAGGWQIFRHVTLPLLAPTIRISMFLAVIGSIQLFDLVWVLTGGGPLNASETMAVTMFQYGFRRFEVGYASAISIAMFLISLAFAVLYQRFILRRDLEGAMTTMGDQR
ncbi:MULTISPECIES: sugar ABC transporter permease [unclassified Solwaraspora]|uniref:carbohydrate ABC transporter permease n=1 Tax=unclassified Solwaraspora TaxID=2627926 RepID=UPI00248BF03A|nr:MULTISPECIES: sugar ABC transporter permease [unclassified Solwaraspora]WBB95557.1 sugar ABC transporter permease [Solwaraspora sp. WMMA2059]WBC20538.1 sugar ABC transporter permease [Solwaraspora sp. WMMA2080]WJK37328.1 sugar ABC transporter permease [Solwaraspora sp. WMMA2065]